MASLSLAAVIFAHALSKNFIISLNPVKFMLSPINIHLPSSWNRQWRLSQLQKTINDHTKMRNVIMWEATSKIQVSDLVSSLDFNMLDEFLTAGHRSRLPSRQKTKHRHSNMNEPHHDSLHLSRKECQSLRLCVLHSSTWNWLCLYQAFKLVYCSSKARPTSPVLFTLCFNQIDR